MTKNFAKLTGAFAIAVSGFGLAGWGIVAHESSNTSAPSSPTTSFNTSSVPTSSATTTAPVITTPPPPPVPPPPPPLQIGQATLPQMEGQNTADQDDLDLSIPGTGIALGGDGVNGYPQMLVPGVYEGNNLLQVPQDSRPVPTGTALGPNGEHYAFYAVVPYHLPDGSFNDKIYTSPDTVVVDLAHPATPLFTLQGISQASGAFDQQSGRMFIVGNMPNGDRALWQSDPISQNWAWGNTLQQVGTFSGDMNGNRENQIVALPNNGGFLMVGASEAPVYKILGFTVGGGAQPIEAVAARTPQELLTATPTALVTPYTVPQVYGPTITDIQQVNDKDVVSMRVSTYGNGKYDPHTYKATFTIKL